MTSATRCAPTSHTLHLARSLLHRADPARSYLPGWALTWLATIALAPQSAE